MSADDSFNSVKNQKSISYYFSSSVNCEIRTTMLSREMSVQFYIQSKQKGSNSITAIRVHSDMLRCILMKS